MMSGTEEAWCELSYSQEKLLAAMIAEIETTSLDIEDQVHRAVVRFKELRSQADLDSVHIAHLITQVGPMAEVKEELAALTEGRKRLATLAGEVVTGLQFQDRISQRLTLITEILRAIATRVAEMREACGETGWGSDIDKEWVTRLLDGVQLGEIRQRLRAEILGENPARPEIELLAGGEIDLF